MSPVLAERILLLEPASIKEPLKGEAAELELACLSENYAPGILYLFACGARQREQFASRDLAWSWVVGTLRAMLESDRKRCLS